MSGSAPPREWDAATYERVSDVQLRWGLEVLERLPLRGDETVLDAGCGTGRVTAALAERLPGGRVVAVDASRAMVDAARAALPERCEVRRADLLELRLDEPVDAAFSTAVFHWIRDHQRLFARIHAALRPGAPLAAQCGGAGNLAGFHARLDSVAREQPFARHLAGFEGAWNFASPEATEARLERAGFREVECWLERRDPRPAEPADFLRAVCLRTHLERLPEELRPRLVERVLEVAGDPLELDYVRLNIAARRAA